jgi:2-aminoadipate transaminase
MEQQRNDRRRDDAQGDDRPGDVMSGPWPRFAAWTRTTNAITRHMVGVQPPGSINLAGGLPAPEIYPLDAVRAATQRALDRFGQRALAYSPVAGIPELRALIAARYSRPGRRLGPDNVLITSGGLQALDFIGRVLVEVGDTILAQFPTYLGAIDAWRPLGARYAHLDWAAPHAVQSAAAAAAKFIYSVPNFSNPTGALVPLERRRALLAACREAGAVLVEDDPYGALFYDGPPVPTMFDLEAERGDEGPYRGNVVYLGTLSKSIGPGLRIGWAVGEAGLIQGISLGKQGSDIGTAAFTQAVAVELLEAGVDRDVHDRMIATYRRRRDALVAAARAHLSLRFDFEAPVGGMFLWLTAKDPAFDTDGLWQVAFDEGVSYAPSSVFDSAGRLKNALRLNFTLNREADLEEGARRLGRAVERHLQRPRDAGAASRETTP